MPENIFQKFYKEELRKIYGRFLKDKSHRNIIVTPNIIGETPDLQAYFERVGRALSINSRIQIVYYNHLWEPILSIASAIGLRKAVSAQNWLDEGDLGGLLNLAGFEVVSLQKRVLLPVNIPLISKLLNNYLGNLPVINNFCLLIIVVARPKPLGTKRYSVSIIVPARNEEENIAKIIPSIPAFGKAQEYIFVEGHSNDATWDEIGKVVAKHRTVKVLKQKGIGKANAVRAGFSKATGEILMIYDADRTVPGEDLLKFYQVLSTGAGEFANGSRLVYPMERQAMQTLNKVGNKMFSLMFSWILGQRLKDTLCGTKAFFRKDYKKFKHSKSDPFGDFDLIFGAVRNNLKIVEIPVRYKEREYGATNIKRFKHGLMLLVNVASAFREFKAW